MHSFRKAAARKETAPRKSSRPSFLAILGGLGWPFLLGLAATSIFLKSPPKHQTHPDANRSYYRSVRVPNGTTCAQLIKHPPKFGR